MAYKKWTRNRALVWCWNFIKENNRLPIKDDILIESSKKSPGFFFILQEFGNLTNLINNCGPISRNTKSYSFKELKDGFERYNEENGHYPSTFEVDDCIYLPTSRLLQRSWGGMQKFRSLIGVKELNLTKGKIRSEKVPFLLKRGADEEDRIEKKLVEEFSEIFVHTQKRVNGIRPDFYIYTPKLIFAIDVFCFERREGLVTQINHKISVYKNFSTLVIFVPINKDLDKKYIDELLVARKSIIPENCKVMTEEELFYWIDSLEKYPLNSLELLSKYSDK